MHLPTKRRQTKPKGTLHAIPSGPPGVRVTLNVMAQLVRTGKTDMAVRDLAGEIVQSLPSKDYIGEVEAVWQWVRDNIRYLRDVQGVETVATPARTLQSRRGDCDDQSVLIGALLSSIGHKIRFAALAFTPHRYSHVFAETMIGKGRARRWLALETTENKPFGWYPQRPHQRMVVGV